MKKRSLAVQVTIVIIVLQILAMGFIAHSSVSGTKDTIRDNTLDNMRIYVNDRADMVEMYIENCTDYLNDFVQNDEVVKACLISDTPENIAKVQKYIDAFAENANNLEGLYVARMDTWTYAHTNPDSVNKSFREGESLKNLDDMLMSHDKAFCTGIVKAPVTGKMVIPVYIPLKDDNGEYIGFAGAAFYTDGLSERLGNMSTHADHNEKFALINADTCEFIFEDNPNNIGQKVTDESILGVLQETKGLDIDKEFRLEGDSRIASCHYMHSRDWLFVGSDSKDKVFGPLNTVVKQMILIVIISSLLLSVLYIVVLRFMFKPLGKIRQSIDRLTGGEVGEDTELEKYDEYKNEYGSIARAVEMLNVALGNQNEIYTELLKSQSIGFFSMESETDAIVLINPEASRMLGLPEDKNYKGTFDEIYENLSKENAEIVRNMIDSLKQTEGREVSAEMKIERPGESPIYALSRGRGVVLSSGKRVLVFTLTDVTKKTQREADLAALSETDGLTQLLNRRSGEEKIKQKLFDCEYGMYILFDINKFKYVNDTFGHSVGDEVLVAVADAMRKTFRSKDILMRMGGDEFVVYSPEVNTPEMARSIIKRFLNNIADIDLERLNGHHISISVGAIICDSQSTIENVYSKTDKDMYDCKSWGGNAYKIYGDHSLSMES